MEVNKSAKGIVSKHTAGSGMILKDFTSKSNQFPRPWASLTSVIGAYQMAGLIAALIAGILGSISVLTLIDQRFRNTTNLSLQAVLAGTHQAMSLWAKDQQHTALSFAQSEEVIAATGILLQENRDQASLLASEGQSRLRAYFRSHLQSNQYRGFFIIAPDATSLASSRDANVGTPNLLVDQPDVLTKLWSGKTALSRIQISDVPIYEGRSKETTLTLFGGAPIIDASGEVIALLTLRIDPYDTLFLIPQHSHIGESGETYIFNSEGMLLSPSRFERRFSEVTLTNKARNTVPQGDPIHPYRPVWVTDPGVDLRTDAAPPIPPKERPLTRMAASAVQGETASDLDGYRNYLGIPVIGAWLWDETFNLGIATEEEISEAYGLFHFVRILIYGASAFTLLGILVLSYAFFQGRRQLLETRNQLKAVVDTAEDGIVIIDSDDRIKSVNPAMETLFGYRAAAMLNNSINLLIPNPYGAKYDDDLREYPETGKTTSIGAEREVEARRADGTPFPIELSVNRLELPTGLHFSWIIRDISQRKEIENNLIQAREDAETANRAKSIFLATMSHEIRTPLNGVVGTIDMLRHTSLLPSQQDMVSTARDSARMLQRVIDDVLDFSKIEAGRLELENIPLSLENLLESLGENLRPQAHQQKVELLLYCDPSLPRVKGDPVRLKQILFNLAGNAIKFSRDLPNRSGQVMIAIVSQTKTADRVDIAIQVQDNGIGMSKGVQRRLFQAFVQGEGETTRRFGGTGLGLVITQRLVELMDGAIQIDSEPDQGSIFNVYLSLEPEEQIAEPLQQSLNGIQILLVTDDDMPTWILETYLLHAGARVITTDFDQAPAICRKLCHTSMESVVVIDNRGDTSVSTPLRDLLRREEKEIDLRYVLVARGRRRYARIDQEDSMTVDLNAMRRATLINTVAAVTGRESPEYPREDSPKVVTITTPVTFEEAKATGRVALLADDSETNRKVISQQLNMLGYYVDSAEDGERALSMWRQGDYDILLTDCHMPNMDGYQLSRSIRTEEKENSHTLIIAVTADALKGTAQKCFAAGIDDYLTKPIELHELRAIMTKWSSPDAASDRNLEPPDRPSDREPLDDNALGRLLGTQDPSALVDYYRDFLETNSRTAEQITAAFETANIVEVGHLAHKMKSSARTVGANGLADCCQAMEQASKAGDYEDIAQLVHRFTPLFEQVRGWIEHKLAE
jgi:PAS domain S-box-containing protein